MGLYDPPRVKVEPDSNAPTHWTATAAGVAIPWLLTVTCLYFVTPTLTEGIVTSMEPGSDAHLTTMLVADLLIDSVFVAVGAYWSLQLSRLPIVATALVFGVSLIALRAVELGGLPGVIETGFPLWYDVLGNLNDLAGALIAALGFCALRVDDPSEPA